MEGGVRVTEESTRVSLPPRVLPGCPAAPVAVLCGQEGRRDGAGELGNTAPRGERREPVGVCAAGFAGAGSTQAAGRPAERGAGRGRSLEGPLAWELPGPASGHP